MVHSIALCVSALCCCVIRVDRRVWTNGERQRKGAETRSVVDGWNCGGTPLEMGRWAGVVGGNRPTVNGWGYETTPAEAG